jgi:L-ascorbate metabolism protein UlaG (beta-lactamase superfamily)
VPLAPDVRLVGVPAQHWSARTLFDKWRRLWLGFVLETPSGSIYFAGDTGFSEPAFEAIRARLGAPRLALLPVAPIRPRTAMAPRHMSAREAVRAARLLGAWTTVAIHFGTFQQGDDAEEEPVDSLRAAATEPNGAGPIVAPIVALRNGEALLIP